MIQNELIALTKSLLMPVMAPCPLGGAVACRSLWGVEQYPVAVGFLPPPFKDSIPAPKDVDKKEKLNP